jgi:polyisoprenoid-binding protein YceI
MGLIMKTKFNARGFLIGSIAAFVIGCGDQSTKSVAAATAAAAPAPAAAEPASGSLTRLDARSGSKMRLEGTSTVHDWQVESPLILGYLEVGPNFPLEAGKSPSPGKVEAKGEATITVKSLRSIEKDGKAYSDTMDQKIYDMMSYTNHPKIVYRLTGLVLKEVPKDKNEPYVFDSTGELAIAGVTNTVSMPVKVLPLEGGKVKITGTISLKMTDYKIEPANIVIAKTGNDVKVIFEWVLGQKKPAAAAK